MAEMQIMMKPGAKVLQSDLQKLRAKMRSSWLGSLVEWLEAHFYANEMFDPEKMTGNQFYSDLANLVDKRSQIIFPATFALFVSIYWGVMVSLAENADNVLEGAILYKAAQVVE